MCDNALLQSFSELKAVLNIISHINRRLHLYLMRNTTALHSNAVWKTLFQYSRSERSSPTDSAPLWSMLKTLILSSTSMHFANADVLRKTLPCRLTRPRPLYPNRREFHASQAAKLQVSGPAKRAAAQEKAAATRAANKAKAAAAQERA